MDRLAAVAGGVVDGGEVVGAGGDKVGQNLSVLQRERRCEGEDGGGEKREVIGNDRRRWVDRSSFPVELLHRRPKRKRDSEVDGGEYVEYRESEKRVEVEKEEEILLGVLARGWACEKHASGDWKRCFLPQWQLGMARQCMGMGNIHVERGNFEYTIVHP